MDAQPNAGNDLVRIHKVITRALKVSLDNSREPNLPESQRPGFIAYVRCLVILLHAHHTGEDELAFPLWQARLPAGPFDVLGEQHRQMIPYLDQIERWTAAGLDAWQASVLGELHHTLSDLQNLWEAHIALEEETVGPEMSRQHLSPSENEQLGRQLSEHGQAHSQPGELVMPFIVYNLSTEDREVFIRLLPPVVSGQLIPVAWKPAWEAMIPFLLFE